VFRPDCGHLPPRRCGALPMEPDVNIINGGIMRVRVVYQSTTGNTKKIAEAIARASGCVAEPVSAATVNEPVDMLFLGGSDPCQGHRRISQEVHRRVRPLPRQTRDGVRHGLRGEQGDGGGDHEGPAGATKNPGDEQALFLSGQVPVLQLPPPQRPGPERGRGVRAERPRRLTLRASVLEQRYPCGETGRPHGAGPDTGLDLSDVRRVQEQHAQP